MHVDVPLAHLLHGTWLPTATMAGVFASAVLLGAEAATALTLMIIRILRGQLSPFREATVLACLTSICAYGLNDSTLKFLFGVPNLAAALNGAGHTFHFLAGSSISSFPAGHMVLAGAFAGVFMRLYRMSILPLSLMLLIAATLLIAGGWHFLSDIIAGTYVGISAGLLAGEVWLVHTR